ncbi:MAG: hypothetical protein ACYC91_12665 [Solirubrobacteraceae bacterium]
MLVARAADTGKVIARVLVLASVSCCLLISVSFLLFARDQLAGASAQQQSELAAAALAASPTTHQKAQPRRFIDGATSALNSPFDSLVNSSSLWVRHILPTLIGLLVYGAGLGYLARYSRGTS